MQVGSRPAQLARRSGSRAGWCWWCRRGVSFGWSDWMWSPDTLGHLGYTVCWSSSWLDDGRWPTHHSLRGENIIRWRSIVCFKFWSIECGCAVPVKASGSMSTHSIVSPFSPTAKMRSISLALYVWDLGVEAVRIEYNRRLLLPRLTPILWACT